MSIKEYVLIPIGEYNECLKKENDISKMSKILDSNLENQNKIELIANVQSDKQNSHLDIKKEKEKTNKNENEINIKEEIDIKEEIRNSVINSLPLKYKDKSQQILEILLNLNNSNIDNLGYFKYKEKKGHIVEIVKAILFPRASLNKVKDIIKLLIEHLPDNLINNKKILGNKTGEGFFTTIQPKENYIQWLIY